MDARADLSTIAIPRWVSQAFVSEFRMEWLALAAVVTLDAFWAVRIGFSVRILAIDLMTLIAVLASTVFFRIVYVDRRGSLIMEYLALSLVSVAAFAVITYLCSAASFPLVDADLRRMDSAIGFHWQYWFGLVHDRPGVLSILRLLYDSIAFQAMFFLVFCGLQRDQRSLREIYWVIFVATVLTAVISTFLPAMGNLDALQDGDQYSVIVHDVKRLRAHSDLHFVLHQLTGLITFPSFHTTTAIIYTYAFRRAGAVGVAIACLNLLMLPSIPLIGRHYLIDMFAGVAIAGVAIAAVRCWPQPASAATEKLCAANAAPSNVFADVSSAASVRDVVNV